MDTLRGIPEHIEAEFGDSILARDEAVALLGGAPGLGPPDLCWLQKAPKARSLLGGSAEAQGYYHYLLGRDVSSTAAVAAYFALLNSKVEPCGVLQGLWSPGFSIQRGFYCCYDALSCMDLRCELCVPGGVVAGCVDAAGTLHDATPQRFMAAQVSSFMRAVLYDPELRANGGSVIAHEPCASAAAERALLGCVMALYQDGSLPGALQDIYAQQGCGVLPEHMDMALAALWQHFRRRQRWEAAAAFFRQLAAVHPAATLLWGAAQRCRGLGGCSGSSGSLLAELLLLSGHRGPEQLCPATLLGLASECLEGARVEEAAVLARQALQASPSCRPALLLLAQCFIAQRQFAAALVALNVVPTPPLPAAEVELLHVAPPPPPKATTQPQAPLYDGELEAVRCCAAEEASLDGSRLLAYLPGSILVNREPLGAGLLPDTSPNRITRSVLAAVYALLQVIVSQTSWDEFLEIRSRVFLMQHEAAPAAGQDTPAQQQQQQQQRSALQGKEQQPQQQQEGVELAAALQQKLGQLGQQASGPVRSGSAAALELHQASEPPCSEEPAANGAQHAGQHGPVPTGASPPSRGRVSSSGGPKGSPKSYYASRLQEELAKPGTGGGGRATSATTPGSSRPPTQQQQQQSPPSQHEQHDQQPGSSSARSAAAAAAAASSAAAAPRAAPPGSGEGERSMAGRVLLLGRSRTRRLSGASSRTPPGSSSSNVFGDSSRPAGCGVPRSLAPNEVEDLSRLAPASKVAPLRTQGSITPQLWDVVFGGTRSPPASGSMAALHHQHQQRAAEAFTSAAALPRIKTRPLGEARERQQQQQQRHNTQLGSSCTCVGGTCGRCSCLTGGIPPETGGTNSLQRLRQQLSDIDTPSGLRSAATATAAAAAVIVEAAAVEAAEQRHRQRQKHHSSSSSNAGSSCPAAGAGPLAEGIDRTGSLLNRSSSAASSAAARLGSAGNSRDLGRSASISHQQQAQGHAAAGRADGGGSSNFGASLARRASAAGEAVSRTLQGDREGLLAGWICDDASAEAATGDADAGRRLCVRWLDELIVALWHDLQAYMEWKVWDHTLREARGGSHAELVLGLVPGQAGSPRTPVSDGGNMHPPPLTCTDWMRRGALAERLGHVSDARAAYRASVKLGFNLAAYTSLLRLEAQAGNASDTVLCAAQVLAWHQQRLAQAGSSGSGSSSGTVRMGLPPEVVAWGLGLVASSSSADEVMTAAAQAPSAAAELKAVLQEWSKWQQVAVPEPLQPQAEAGQPASWLAGTRESQ